jgi:hypothetical protein
MTLVTLDRPAVLGIVFGVIIGAVYITLQRRELRQKSMTIQPRGVAALAPGAAGRLVFLVAAWWLVFEFTEADRSRQILVDGRFGRYLYCAAFGSVAAVTFSQKVRFSDGRATHTCTCSNSVVWSKP